MRSGLSPSTIGNLEHGSQPDLSTLLSLQAAFEFASIEQVLGPAPSASSVLLEDLR